MKLTIHADNVHISLPVPKCMVLSPWVLRLFLSKSGQETDIAQLRIFCSRVRALCRDYPNLPLMDIETDGVHIQIRP